MIPPAARPAAHVPGPARAVEDRRTTLMIKNIPNKYTQKMLLQTMDEQFRGGYDFFYLPIDFKNKCNVGYAFINLVRFESGRALACGHAPLGVPGVLAGARVSRFVRALCAGAPHVGNGTPLGASGCAACCERACLRARPLALWPSLAAGRLPRPDGAAQRFCLGRRSSRMRPCHPGTAWRRRRRARANRARARAQVDPGWIPPLVQRFNAKKWEKFNSEKVCHISYARIQGKQALVTHFQNSSLMHEDKRCRPVLFHIDGPLAGDQEPFPVGPNVRPPPPRAPGTFFSRAAVVVMRSCSRCPGVGRAQCDVLRSRRRAPVMRKERWCGAGHERAYMPCMSSLAHGPPYETRPDPGPPWGRAADALAAGARRGARDAGRRAAGRSGRRRGRAPGAATAAARRAGRARLWRAHAAARAVRIQPGQPAGRGRAWRDAGDAGRAAGRRSPGHAAAAAAAAAGRDVVACHRCRRCSRPWQLVRRGGRRTCRGRFGDAGGGLYLMVRLATGPHRITCGCAPQRLQRRRQHHALRTPGRGVTGAQRPASWDLLPATALTEAIVRWWCISKALARAGSARGQTALRA